MVSTNTTGDKPLFLTFPSVVVTVSSAALALLLLASSSSSCGDANCNSSSINSSSSINNIYRRLGVRQPHNTTKVIQLGRLGIQIPLSRWSWKLHGRLLPVLHFSDHRHNPPDVFVNLRVLWCKLLVSLDPGSPAYEGNRNRTFQKKQNRRREGYTDGSSSSNSKEGELELETELETSPSMLSKDHQLLYYATYRMLPPYSIKWALRYLGLWRIFPRWMHANIELRTVYLQTALKTVLGSREKHNRKDCGNSPESKNAFSDSTIASTALSSKASSTASSTMSELDDGPTLGTSNADNNIDIDNNYNTERICVIILGGGYDPMGAKLLSASYGYSGNSKVQRVYELDLPPVVDSKRRLLRRAGFDVVDDRGCDGTNSDNVNDNVNHNDNSKIRLEGVDLNDDTAVDRVLDSIRHELLMMISDPHVENDKHKSDHPRSANSSTTTNAAAAAAVSINTTKKRWRVVLVSEAVLMYLDPGKAERILEGVAERFRGSSRGGRFCDASFVFADRLMRRGTNNNNNNNNNHHHGTTFHARFRSDRHGRVRGAEMARTQGMGAGRFAVETGSDKTPRNCHHDIDATKGRRRQKQKPLHAS